jgi:Cupin
VVLDGSCRLTVNGCEEISVQNGGFVLIPPAYRFTISSIEPTPSEDSDTVPVALLHGEFRLGAQSGPPDVLPLVGQFAFDSPDAALLVSPLPQLAHVRGEPRLATIVELVGEGSRAHRPARDVILARLL